MSKRKNQSSDTSDTENAQDVPQPPAKRVNKYSGMEVEQALGEL